MSTPLNATHVAAAYRLAQNIKSQDRDTLEPAFEILLSLMLKVGVSECRAVLDACAKIGKAEDEIPAADRPHLQLIQGGAL